MIIYVVQAGDSLWTIANKYDTSVTQIEQINGLPDPNILLIGQALVIPVPITTHIVQQGESLWSIARHYDISLQELLQFNDIIEPNAIDVGTQLYIPPIRHIVRPGETLTSISQAYGIPVESIAEANDITNPNDINIGTVLIIPRTKPTIEVNAYTYQTTEAAVKSLNAIGSLLTYFSPFAYMIEEDSSLEPLDDEQMIAAALEQNIVPMMSITNFTSTEAGSNLAHTVLSTPELRATLIDNVLSVMQEKGYLALNIDFENVLPEDRENYNELIQLAVDRLHPYGYIVSTALAPKVSEEQAGLLYEAHDYEAHGEIADFVVLMTYEWGYRKGPPQPISPLNQMEKVIQYALTLMPPEKIFLGFQIYARDWLLPHVQGQEAETFSPQEAIRRANKYGVPIQYNEVAASPFFRYVDEQGRQHEVWFEDARSAQAKFDLTKKYNLAGISYWALGFPYPQNWVLLNDNFNVKRLL